MPEICERAEPVEGANGPIVRHLSAGVHAGRQVRVRGAAWTLRALEHHADCAELQLECPAAGDRRVLLWPFDRPAAVVDRERWRFRPLPRWLATVRHHSCQRLPHPHLRARPAGARVLAYQLAPALAIATGCRRLILADEVGLGKTVQAGWIIADLIERRPDARVLAAVPAGLRLQWRDELAALFGLRVEMADARWLSRTIGDLPAGVSPWAPPGIYAVSLDFLKRPDVAAAVRAAAWDLLVVDEAHTAAAPTERHAALASIARGTRAVVLLTATPHSGDGGAFASLSELGASGKEPPLIFRRSREDIGDPRQRRHRFVRVRLGPVESRFQRLLDRYCRALWHEAPGAEARLAAMVLRKRALSSPGAAAASLRRRARLIGMLPGTAVQLPLFGDDDREDADDEPIAVLGAPGLADVPREQRWLESLASAADAAAMHDSKRRFLRRLLRRTGGEAAVVFTEFRDTLLDLAAGHPESLHLHGGMSAAARAAVQERFNREGGLLFATDTAAEGLNLHGRCRLVVNFELPWNPARLEQRIGRVDRIGQPRPVHALTLVARDTGEDVVIARFVRRLERIACALGASDRLAGFLSDAQTARMVIGGEAPAELPPAPLPVAQPVPPEAIVEAGRLRRARQRRPGGSCVVVGTASVSSSLPRGVLFVAEWRLREPSGSTICAEPVALHVDCSVPAARGERDVLAFARQATASWREHIHAAACAHMQRMREAVAMAHQHRVQVALDRERWIAAGRQISALTQPGLFDRTVAREVAEAATAVDALGLEAAEELNRLRRAREIEASVAVRAVLLVRGGR